MTIYIIITCVLIIATILFFVLKKEKKKIETKWGDQLQQNIKEGNIKENELTNKASFWKTNPHPQHTVINVKKGKRRYTLMFIRMPGQTEYRFNLGRYDETELIPT